MNENITKMLEMLSKDEEAQKKLQATRDPDEAYAIVSEIHGGYTKEEFVEVMTAINEALNQDLTAEDLAQTAGGDDKEVENAIFGIKTSATIVATAASWLTAGTASGVLSAMGTGAAAAV